MNEEEKRRWGEEARGRSEKPAKCTLITSERIVRLCDLKF